MTKDLLEPWHQGKEAQRCYAFNNTGTAVATAPAEVIRRIVACVNACKGISTSVLELQGVPSLELCKRLEQQRDELLRLLGVHPAENAMELAAKASKDLHMSSMQSNELLAALKRASESLGRFVSDEGWAQADMDCMDDVDAVIAKVEGKNGIS